MSKSELIDITGERFGKLCVIGRADTKHNYKWQRKMDL